SMRVLFFVDTHGLRSLDRIEEKSKDSDVLVCCGDITDFGMDLDKILKKLNSIGKKVILIHGNHESDDLGLECKDYTNISFIHRAYEIVGDYIFYGFGGGGFSYTDSEFRRESENFMKEYEELCKTNNKKYKLILLTHAPPFETKLDMVNKYEGHVGNKDIKNFILKYKPFMAVSGHIHESAGSDETLEGVRLINPGSSGMIIKL
ncbi:MAG TPA: metallophosphoesterase, partial [Allocoleopsis sp.]